MNKTAIVIGATGLIGSSLVQLLAKSEEFGLVKVITRRPIEYASSKIENHVIDFDSLSKNKHLFDADVLFSCLGTTLKQAGSVAAQRLVDLDYQYIAAKLASEQGVEHYLLVSSSGANHKSMSAYLKIKGELERKVQSLTFKHTSILQPSLLLGDRQRPRFFESLAAKVLPVLCRIPGLGRYRPIPSVFVAQKMLELSIRPSAGFQRIRLNEVFPN